MNLNLSQTGGGLLLVPQFTLAADTCRGMRPSFTPAAEPEDGRTIVRFSGDAGRQLHSAVGNGRFACRYAGHALVNDGPVTFWLEVGRADRSVRQGGWNSRVFS